MVFSFLHKIGSYKNSLTLPKNEVKLVEVGPNEGGPCGDVLKAPVKTGGL